VAPIYAEGGSAADSAAADSAAHGA
jgi:hypothetical protein